MELELKQNAIDYDICNEHNLELRGNLDQAVAMYEQAEQKLEKLHKEHEESQTTDQTAMAQFTANYDTLSRLSRRIRDENDRLNTVILDMETKMETLLRQHELSTTAVEEMRAPTLQTTE